MKIQICGNVPKIGSGQVEPAANTSVVSRDNGRLGKTWLIFEKRGSQLVPLPLTHRSDLRLIQVRIRETIETVQTFINEDLGSSPMAIAIRTELPTHTAFNGYDLPRIVVTHLDGEHPA